MLDVGLQSYGYRYIFAGHVAEYMETLADDDEERYKSQFQQYIDDDIEG